MATRGSDAEIIPENEFLSSGILCALTLDQGLSLERFDNRGAVIHRRIYYRGILLFTTGVLLTVASNACGAELDKALVASKFRSKYRCQSERVSKVTGGYVVQGCGFRDEYVCVDSCCEDDGFLEGLMFGSDTCVLARSYSLSNSASGFSKPSIKKLIHQTGGYIVLRTAFPTRDAKFIVLGAPSEEPQQVLLILRIKPGEASRENCTLELVGDGERLPVHKQSYLELSGIEQFAFVIPLSTLKNIGEATRVIGRVCDYHFEINQSGRETLKLFEVRFREEMLLGEGKTRVEHTRR